MSIKQINIFTCDICGQDERVERETELYSDPVVTPPRLGWGEIVVIGDEEKQLCNECYKRENVMEDKHIKRLNEMEEPDGGEFEDLHREADEILCERLIELGEAALVDAYRRARKRVGFYYA